MKSAIATAVAFAAIRAAAQNSSASVTAAPSTSYVYEEYDACSTAETELETATVTSTYCHVCEEEASSSFIAAGGTYTTYTTTYSEFCSTGLQDKTYTVTESCSSPHPTASREASYVPQGFTVTTATCHVCGPTPVVATLTTPTPEAVTPSAGSGPVNAPATETGGSSPPTSGGSPAAAGESSPASGGSSAGSPPAGEAAPASEESSLAAAPSAGGAGGPAAAPYATPARYGSAPTGAPGSGSSGNSSAPITPFTGAASSLGIGMPFMGMIVGVVVVLASTLW